MTNIDFCKDMGIDRELMIEGMGCVGYFADMDKETIETTFGPLDCKAHPVDHKEPPKGLLIRACAVWLVFMGYGRTATLADILTRMASRFRLLAARHLRSASRSSAKAISCRYFRLANSGPWTRA